MSNQQKAKYSDLFLVTYLLLKNHEVILTEKNPEDDKTIFIFEDSPALQSDVTHFFEDDEVSIRIRSFSRRYRDVIGTIRHINPLGIKGYPKDNKEAK